MDKQAIVRKILSATQMETISSSASSGGPAWLGQPSGISQQVNDSLRLWLEKDDDQAIIGAIELLQTVSLLTEPEAAELIASVRSL